MGDELAVGWASSRDHVAVGAGGRVAKRLVETIHFHKQGTGEGAWFRLKDGRVIDKFARAAESDPAFYDATTH